jgi:small conductance mechanosensitive channel
MANDPAYGPKLPGPPEVPGVEQFGDSAVTVRMMLMTRPGEQWSIARETRRRIKAAFDREGIEIPVPQRIVYQLSGSGPASAASLAQAPASASPGPVPASGGPPPARVLEPAGAGPTPRDRA